MITAIAPVVTSQNAGASATAGQGGSAGNQGGGAAGGGGAASGATQTTVDMSVSLTNPAAAGQYD